MCDISLAKKVTLENAIEMFEMGDIFEASNLKNVAKGFIVTNPSEIVGKKGWEDFGISSERFLKLYRNHAKNLKILL